jgi:hypothetical protein
LDQLFDGLGVDWARPATKASGELSLWSEAVFFIKSPHLFTIRTAPEPANETSREAVKIVHVTKKEGARIEIACSVDRLWKVDDHRPVPSQKDVEVGQVAVHDARAKHQHRLRDENVVDLRCLFFRVVEIAQSRCGISVRILNEFHQEDPVDVDVWLRNPNARRTQTVDHLYLGAAPRVLIARLTVFGPLGHRALVAAVAHLAPFHVVSAILKRTHLRVLVDLGCADLAFGDDEIDLRFLSAHEWAEDFFDHTVFRERFEALGQSHGEEAEPFCGGSALSGLLVVPG